MIVIAGGSWAAVANARSGDGWRRLSASEVLTTGPYTVLQDDGAPTVFSITDERTGTAFSVQSPADCGQTSAPVAGGGHLVLQCASTIAELTPPSRAWTELPIPAGCLDVATTEFEGSCGLTSVGRFWAALEGSCYHCATGTEVVPLAGAEETTTPDDPYEFADLDDRSLYRYLCRPLVAPMGASVTFDGPFVIETRPRLRVERCGRRAPLVSTRSVYGVAIRPGLVLWSEDRTIEGVCLPSGRRVEIASPRGVVLGDRLELSLRYVFLDDAKSRWWQAARPNCDSVPRAP